MLDSNNYIKYIYYLNSTKLNSIIGKHIHTHSLFSRKREEKGGERLLCACYMKGNRKYYAKDICAIFDISKATLFRWENEGLISGIKRDWRNWRIYSDENIEEIKKIIESKEKR